MIPSRLRGLAKDRKGVTLVEFAAIAAPLVALIFGALDLAYQGYATAIVQGTANSAARKATLEGATTSAIQTYVENQLSSITDSANVQVSATNFLTYSKIGKPEKLTTDVDGDGQYDKSGPDCFIDDNRNNAYDAASQGASGLGTAEDVVRYQVTATYHRLSPLPFLLGMGNTVTITRTTFMRNEPYAGTIDPPTKCGV